MLQFFMASGGHFGFFSSLNMPKIPGLKLHIALLQ